MKRIVFAVIILIFSVLKPLSAEEAIVRIANVDGRVLQSYLRSGLNIFSRNETFSEYLGQALDSGIIADDAFQRGKKYIFKRSLVKRELSAASRDINSLLPFRARVSGRSSRHSHAAWQKYIINFPENKKHSEGVFELTPDNNTYKTETVSHIAVKNEAGVFERWHIVPDRTAEPYGKSILRIKRRDLLQQLWQKNGLEWFLGLLPEDQNIAILILENSSPDGFYKASDTVLLFLRPEKKAQKDRRLQDISIVIGWFNCGPS